jgi:hypothetical protein
LAPTSPTSGGRSVGIEWVSEIRKIRKCNAGHRHCILQAHRFNCILSYDCITYVNILGYSGEYFTSSSCIMMFGLTWKFSPLDKINLKDCLQISNEGFWKISEFVSDKVLYFYMNCLLTQNVLVTLIFEVLTAVTVKNTVVWMLHRIFW